jgi:hypothetical protein
MAIILYGYVILLGVLNGMLMNLVVRQEPSPLSPSRWTLPTTPASSFYTGNISRVEFLLME